MHWTKELKAENVELKSRIREGIEEIMAIRKYLNSSKFREDTTVQVSDILIRLNNVECALDGRMF